MIEVRVRQEPQNISILCHAHKPLAMVVVQVYDQVSDESMVCSGTAHCSTTCSLSHHQSYCRTLACLVDAVHRTIHHDCVTCRHGALQHYCWWNRYVANPIKKWGYVGKGRAAMRLLKNEILEKVLLRRTKVQQADVLALPPRYTLVVLLCAKQNFLRLELFAAYSQGLYVHALAIPSARFSVLLHAVFVCLGGLLGP